MPHHHVHEQIMRIKIILAALVITLFGISAAAASSSCMTLSEAHHASSEHLYWHPNGKGRCWDANNNRRHVNRIAVPIPRDRPELPVIKIADVIPIVAIEEPEPVQDWHTRWPDALQIIEQPKPPSPIEPVPSSQSPSIAFLIIVMVMLSLAVIDVLFGHKIFNRRHSKAMRDGYYT